MSILVRNLPKAFTEQALAQLFENYGVPLSCDLVMDEHSGLSKGFGFVELASPEATNKAIKGLNGMVIEGKKIRVKWSNQEKKQASYVQDAPVEAPPEDVWANATGVDSSSQRDEDA